MSTSTGKKSSASGSGSNAGVSFSSIMAQALKFDKLPKLTKASDYRTWYNTTEMILGALELWDII